jgi:hypothetical protein
MAVNELRRNSTGLANELGSANRRRVSVLLSGLPAAADQADRDCRKQERDQFGDSA